MMQLLDAVSRDLWNSQHAQISSDHNLPLRTNVSVSRAGLQADEAVRLTSPALGMEIEQASFGEASHFLGDIVVPQICSGPMVCLRLARQYPSTPLAG